MSKDFVDKMIHNMRLAGLVGKASPWSLEGLPAGRQGFGDKEKNLRFIGVKLQDDWLEIFPLGNNFLLKFIIDRHSAYLEFYLANKPPFLRILSKSFTDKDKWEILLGEFKRRLKKDKLEFINHQEKAGNLYALIKPHLK